MRWRIGKKIIRSIGGLVRDVVEEVGSVARA